MLRRGGKQKIKMPSEVELRLLAEADRCTKTGDISMELDERPKPKVGEELMREAGPTDIKPNPNSGVVWHSEKHDANGDGRIRSSERMNRSISTVTIDAEKGLVFAPDFSGFLHAVDAKTGKQLWKHDMFAAIWGSPMVIDGKVYLGDEDGDVTVLAAERAMKVIAESNMGSSVYSTPVPANGTLFVVNRNQLVALAEGAGGSTASK